MQSYFKGFCRPSGDWLYYNNHKSHLLEYFIINLLNYRTKTENKCYLAKYTLGKYTLLNLKRVYKFCFPEKNLKQNL